MNFSENKTSNMACEHEVAVVRIPVGLAEKINEIAVHKLRQYSSVSEFVIESTRQKLELIEK